MPADPGLSSGLRPVIGNVAQVFLKEAIKHAGKGAIKRVQGKNGKIIGPITSQINENITTPVMQIITTTRNPLSPTITTILRITTALTMVSASEGNNNGVTSDTCTPTGVIQLEQTFQIVRKQDETLDLTQQVKDMQDISETATSLLPHLQKGLSEKALKDSRVQLAGTYFPQQYPWQELGTPRKMVGTGDMALTQCSGMGGTFPPIHKAHDLPELGKILTRHHMTHAFLLVDSLPGALTSPISGAQIAKLPTALADVYNENRIISYLYDTVRRAWTVSPLSADSSRSYICIFPTDARHTPGMTNRMKGAIRGLTDNLEKYQSHYSTFFKILNGAVSTLGPLSKTNSAIPISSPVLTQLLGNLNLLQSKSDWTQFNNQDYRNIAKAGQLMRGYLTRYPTGPKAITVNKDHKLQKFQPNHISGAQVQGTAFTKQGASWVKIHKVHGFINPNDGSRIATSRVVETDGTYYGVEGEVDKLQCDATLAGGEVCASIKFPKSKQAEDCLLYTSPSPRD